MNVRWFSILREGLAFVAHLAAHLFSYPTTAIGRLIRHWRRYGTRFTLQGICEFADGLFIYRQWCSLYDTATERTRATIAARAERFEFKPLISVVMPVWNTPETFLRRAIESVLVQSYKNWELCIADDSSTVQHVRHVLAEYVHKDPRIKVVLREANGHIAEASNSALEMCAGEFVALLDHDDELSPDALFWVVVALNENPRLELIYSDEDKIDARGRRFGHYFKPDWNPDLFRCQNMISHLGIYRTTTMRAAGGFRKGYEGCQDWDLALRVIERIEPQQICHIPRVLYHWRTVPGSTAIGPTEKSYVVETTHRTISDHLARCGVKAEVSTAFGAYVRIRYPLPISRFLVSIVVDCRSFVPSSEFWESLSKSADNLDIEFIACVKELRDAEFLDTIKGVGIRLLPVIHSASRSNARNTGAGAAHGEVLCFLSPKIKIISSSWLRELCSQAIRSEIGAVGARILLSKDAIRHAGIRVQMEEQHVVRVCYAGSWSGTRGYAGRAALVQNVSAVSGDCLVIRKAVFGQVNGFDDSVFPNTLADVDLCLRVMQAKYRNLWTPYAEVLLPGSLSTSLGNSPEAERSIAFFRERWSGLFGTDPFHNPNLSLADTAPALAFPPRFPPLFRDPIDVTGP